MKVTCLIDAAFINLFERVVNHLQAKPGVKPEKWITGGRAMDMSHIDSKATFQKFRNQGKIRFSQPEKKRIVYDTDSLRSCQEITCSYIGFIL